MIRGAGAVLLTLALAGGASAHDGKTHGNVAAARAHVAETASAPLGPATPFPLKIGGPFDLLDQQGTPRSQVNPEGRPQLLFFGYANCQAICSVALPLMAEIAEATAARGVPVTPVMITVDPERDTVETLAAPLRKYHPDFVGLTGSEAALQATYAAFSVERKLVFEDPDLGPVYAHGSHIYLLDGQGNFLTLIPPILSPARAAEIVLSYTAGG